MTQEEAEAARIRSEYERRAQALPADFYALSREPNLFAHQSRERELRALLDGLGLLPLTGRSLLEIGCGDGEWFATFERLGLDLGSLAGIDLDDGRSGRARTRAGKGDIRVGDAAQLPWPDRSFDLVFQSTVFSSILNADVRAKVAAEMCRVLRPGGWIVWYDFAFNNPSNANVQGMKRRELERLFPRARMESRRVTLAPPLSRRLVSLSWLAAEVLERLRLLNTHLLVGVSPS